jgi:triacylglycerol esterase/lipase EstA (alpha/beta hydrolase family)
VAARRWAPLAAALALSLGACAFSPAASRTAELRATPETALGAGGPAPRVAPDNRAPRVSARPTRGDRPVLLVHGLLDTRSQFNRIHEALRAAGFGPVVAIDLSPNDASVPIRVLAHQVAGAVEVLRGASGQDRVDVVGYSMGALASRYYVQRLGGRERVRRFVSISGPQHGTWLAWLWFGAGIREMRPGSALVRDLASDDDPWGPVEVHVLYSPFDLVIVPPSSSRLPGAVETRTFPVLAHTIMLFDPEVRDAVVEILSRPARAESTPGQRAQLPSR